MKKVFFFLTSLFLFSGMTMAQNQTTLGTTTTLNIVRGGIEADSLLKIPVRDTLPWYGKQGDFVRKASNGKLYYYSGTQWAELGASIASNLQAVTTAGNSTTNSIIMSGTLATPTTPLPTGTNIANNVIAAGGSGDKGMNYYTNNNGVHTFGARGIVTTFGNQPIIANFQGAVIIDSADQANEAVNLGQMNNALSSSGGKPGNGINKKNDTLFLGANLSTGAGALKFLPTYIVLGNDTSRGYVTYQNDLIKSVVRDTTARLEVTHTPGRYYVAGKNTFFNSSAFLSIISEGSSTQFQVGNSSGAGIEYDNHPANPNQYTLMDKKYCDSIALRNVAYWPVFSSTDSGLVLPGTNDLYIGTSFYGGNHPLNIAKGGIPKIHLGNQGDPYGQIVLGSAGTNVYSAVTNETLIGTNGLSVLSSGVPNFFAVTANVQNSGSAGYSALQVRSYEYSLGTGPNLLINAGTLNAVPSSTAAFTSKFTVDNTGLVKGSGFIKSGGTATQMLQADGSVISRLNRSGIVQVSSNTSPTISSITPDFTLTNSGSEDAGYIDITNTSGDIQDFSCSFTYSQAFPNNSYPVITTSSSAAYGKYEIVTASASGFTIKVTNCIIGTAIRVYYQVKGN